MDERQKDLSNYRITQADDSLKVADYCLKETNESIYITQNDEGDMVIKSIDTYEKSSIKYAQNLSEFCHCVCAYCLDFFNFKFCKRLQKIGNGWKPF